MPCSERKKVLLIDNSLYVLIGFLVVSFLILQGCKNEEILENSSVPQAVEWLPSTHDVNATVDAEVLSSLETTASGEPSSITQAPVVQESVQEESPVQEPLPEAVVEEPVVQEPASQEPVEQEPVVQEPASQEPVEQEPVVQEPTLQEPTIQEPEQTFVYEDGSYTQTGAYHSPAGPESITITLTLDDDVVIGLTVLNNAVNSTSKSFQNLFISGINAWVVGQPLDSLGSFGPVNGSSLTPVGFNQALAAIKVDAKT